MKYVIKYAQALIMFLSLFSLSARAHAENNLDNKHFRTPYSAEWEKTIHFNMQNVVKRTWKQSFRQPKTLTNSVYRHVAIPLLMVPLVPIALTPPGLFVIGMALTDNPHNDPDLVDHLITSMVSVGAASLGTFVMYCHEYLTKKKVTLTAKKLFLNIGIPYLVITALMGALKSEQGRILVGKLFPLPPIKLNSDGITYPVQSSKIEKKTMPWHKVKRICVSQDSFEIKGKKESAHFYFDDLDISKEELLECISHVHTISVETNK